MRDLLTAEEIKSLRQCLYGWLATYQLTLGDEKDIVDTVIPVIETLVAHAMLKDKYREFVDFAQRVGKK